MISLHSNLQQVAHIYWYSVYSNILAPSLTVMFFYILFISLLTLYGKNITIKVASTINFGKLFFITILLITLFLYTLKFIGNFWVINVISNINTVLDTYKYSPTYSLNTLTSNFSVFSDTIVILCIGVTFISWVYLSERNLIEKTFNLVYFFIFIILTVNMVYTQNLLTMFIFFEFIFLPSIYFVYSVNYSKKVDKTVKYLLIWTLTGSFLVVCGLSYLYSIIGTLNVSHIYWIQFTKLEGIILFLLFFIGFGIKIPLWPFHYWLTKVHVEAPTGFSIFLSGFLVKTAFYCLTYFCFLFKTKELVFFSLTILIWGAIDASFRMWTANDIKRLIAFATIQEMNLLLGLFFLVNNSYIQFVNLFLLVHGILSALLFFLIDQVQKHYQTRNLTVISGLVYLAPALHTIIWFGILIFRGFPIFIKFFIEWEILSILIYTYRLWGFILFVIISIFGVLGFCRVWLSILYGQPNNLVSNVDILKKDIFIVYMLVGGLLILNFFIIFF